MQANEILNRSDFFTGTDAEIKKAFHKMVATWHPDVCRDPMAGAVMEHLLKLRDRALSGGRAKPGLQGLERILETRDGRRLRVGLHSVRASDFGEILVGDQTVTFVFSADAEDIGQREAKAIETFRYADDKMRKQMVMALPKVLREMPLTGNRHAIVQKRQPGEVLLADLLERDGPMDPKHAAWLGSGLLNIACWMSWARMVHGAISPEMILVDTATHNVRLIGGWGMSLGMGERPDILPERTVQRLPRLAVAGQTVDSSVDLELIRLTVSEALGQKNLKAILPKEMFAWLSFPPRKTAMEDYAAWHEALVAAWGPRKFVQYGGMTDY
ncbi:MAG: J domain-containing protein [Roseibium sp.]|uniref:J domain-containing protein n=1 Tax=Roseibium sp. TaxID=1936156 RepID=UPI0032979B95